MTQNPYAPDAGHQYDGAEPPAPRVSLLAIFSLVCSLICCIPGLGLLGSALGIGGVVAVGRSQGRLRGSGMAIAGIVLGLLTSMGWIGVIVGGTWVSQQMNHNIQEPILAAAGAGEQGDWTRFRALLKPQAQAEFTDERAAAFSAEYHAKFGAYLGADPAPDIARLIQQMQAGPRRVSTGAGGIEAAIPVPLRFDNGTVYVFVIQDSPDLLREAMINNRSIQGRLQNIGLEGPGGDRIWLIPLPPSPTPAGATPPAGKPSGTP